MKVDLSLVISFAALALGIFGALAAYVSTLRLKGTVYNAVDHRVDLDRTRLALEADMRRMYDDIYRDKGRWEEINHLAVDSSKLINLHSRSDQSRSAINTSRFLSNFGLLSEDLKVEPDQVFVLTPLSSVEQESYDAVMLACQDAGLRSMRGDEQNISGAILPVIIKEIAKSRFIIANLNGRNPNVFYEMGLAQALGKDVLMFANRGNLATMPFDIAQQQIIFYETPDDLYNSMKKAIAQLGWGMARSIG